MPLNFPSYTRVIEEDVRRFRQLPPRQQALTMFDLIASGAQLLEHSSHRAAILEQTRRQEEAWQRAHQKLFHEHGL